MEAADGCGNVPDNDALALAGAGSPCGWLDTSVAPASAASAGPLADSAHCSIDTAAA